MSYINIARKDIYGNKINTDIFILLLPDLYIDIQYMYIYIYFIYRYICISTVYINIDMT